MDRLLKVMLLVLAIICVSLYGYLFWSSRVEERSGPAGPAASLAQESVDLWEAYERARTSAEESGAAVQPVSASAQWQSATEDALLNGAGQWSFGFYAPDDQKTLSVVATKESARVASQTPARDAPMTLAEGTWEEGPRDPLLVFLARGGREFLERHEETVVSVHLANRDGEGSLWDVAALSTDDRSVLALRIDAETLEVRSSASKDGEE